MASAVPASASTAKIYHAGSCKAQGDYAVCVTPGGTATGPRDIYVNVESHPDQSVLISWSMVCAKGLGAGSRSGQFTARTPVTWHLIRHPYRYPDYCVVSADAQLSNGGSLVVWLTYTR